MAIDFRNSYPTISWDLNKKNLHINYFGKKDDSARGFKIQILQDTDIVTPTTESLRIYCTKPDKTNVYVNAVPSGDLFIIDLNNQVFAVAGTVECELQLSSDGEWLTSETFYIKVNDNLVDGSILSSDDYIALRDALDSIENSIEQVNTAVTQVNTALTNTNTAISNAETAIANANNATLSANTATTNANNAATNANNKASLADTATTNANTATTNANNARYLGEYVGTTSYKISNIVKYQNALYICKANTTGNLPTNTIYWDISSKQFNWKGNYDNATAYTALDAVYYLGSSYICTQNSTGNIPTNSTYFDPLSLKGDKGATLSPKGSYNSATTYVLNDLVNYNSSVWQCLQTSTGVTPAEGVNWTIFLTGGGAIGDLGTLNTTDKTTAVNAINEVNSKVGDTSLLNTTSNTDLVRAINESNGHTYDGRNYKINNPYKYGGSLALKGQLHCHTTNSDGVDSPSALVTAYKNVGYNFIAITDHSYITPDPSVSGITFIQSSEESYTSHLAVYDISSLSTLTHMQDAINYQSAQHKLCSIAHPNWESYIIDKNEMIGYFDYNFTEIYNAVTNTYAEDLIDAVLSSGKRTFYLAVDDCHGVSTSSFNKGWVVVHANTNDKVSILDGLRKGNFYASNGNDITISVSDNVITASSTSSSNISFVGKNGAVLQANNGVTSASYTILGDEMYIRVKSTKISDNTFAWGQPIFIEVIGGDERKQLDIVRNSNLYGMQRQAIINGGFDINQRGVETETITNNYPLGYFVDMFFHSGGITGVTLPNITRYRRVVSINTLKNPVYTLGLSWDGAEVGTLSGLQEYGVVTRIENGTRYLCGTNKKVTISFYAKSNVAGKRIGVVIKQRYGTGGSPSASETLGSKTYTLKDSFDKYTITVNTNTLYGKTFGTDDNDYLQVSFAYVWNNSDYYEGTEYFGDANSVELAQVQLNSGDIALPYCQKSYEEELSMCRRYFEAPQNAISLYCGYANTLQGFNYRTRKRIAPTVTFKGFSNGVSGVLTLFNDGGVSTTVSGGSNTIDGYSQVLVSSANAGQMYVGSYQASAEM